MTITFDAAERLAHEALGPVAAGSLRHRDLPGGWRFWPAPTPGVLGGTHVLVATSGAVRTIAAGMLDGAAARLLAG